MEDATRARETILRFNRILEHLPELTVRVRERYPDGSYERAAFERFNAVIPELRSISSRMLKTSDFRLSQEEQARFSNMLATYADFCAILKEIGWA